MSFFRTLNYSSCNEDGQAELRALDLLPGDVVGCITGSGDRVLHMLLGDPERVYAFDANPVQNHLLELKTSAIRRLNYSGYVRFLGLFPDEEDRLVVYDRLRHDLSEDALAWFDCHQGMIRSGILYAGRWERYFRASALGMRLLRGSKIRRLFAFDDLAAQRQTLRRRLDRVIILRRTLTDMLESDEGRQCNKFSLSDVSLFLNPDEYCLLFQRLAAFPERPDLFPESATSSRGTGPKRRNRHVLVESHQTYPNHGKHRTLSASASPVRH